MSALQRLQEKILELKEEYQSLKKENIQLQNQLKDVDVGDTESLKSEIATLKEEQQQKDKEIDKIIQQVEALLA
ncbi:MAG: Unknown protein [uncultured Sulfurovum sp.]|uniref:Cell division protein ZapB n=1 Tax=uncultured Sulfurovum sp. TaxID=269237 RepID=A0A6S6TM76_9BACT|nr:MAG: Unknown protein [uncultured Sulfurovum sp.]